MTFPVIHVSKTCMLLDGPKLQLATTRRSLPRLLLCSFFCRFPAASGQVPCMGVSVVRMHPTDVYITPARGNV